MNGYPYRIHLRGPWEYEPLAHTALLPDGRMEVLDRPLPPTGRMTMPCRWSESGLPDFQGRVRFRRRFQKPRQVDENERLWLTFDGADYFTTVWLNGEEIGRHEGAFDPFDFEVTKLVQQRNELVVEADCPAETEKGRRMFRGALPQGGGMWGDVAIEVRREAYLRDLLLTPAFPYGKPSLSCYAKLVDERERPLELYVLLDGHTILYEKVIGSPAGQPFQFEVEVPEVETWQPRILGNPRLYDIQVELIDVSTKLDIQARSMGFRELSGAEEDGTLRVNGRELAIESVLDLRDPVVAAAPFDQADRDGKLVSLRLPIPKPRSDDDDHVRAERLRQWTAIIKHMQHHPSLVGGQSFDSKGRSH